MHRDQGVLEVRDGFVELVLLVAGESFGEMFLAGGFPAATRGQGGEQYETEQFSRREVHTKRDKHQAASYNRGRISQQK